MKRIGMINQRYGLEVNGGSEYYTRLIAERFNGKYEIEILTTTAIDNITWENYYEAGVTNINGVTVRRFPIEHAKDMDAFNEINRQIFENPAKATCEQEWKWIEEQGPLSTELVRYVAEHHEEYDAFIVVTYLYYTQIKSLSHVGHKAIFIPTAHEEPFIHFGIFQQLFTLPKAYIFLTDEEKKLVHNLFPVRNIRYDVLGVGVDVPPKVSSGDFRKKFNIDNDYILYVGRIEGGKGFPELFDHFIRYKNRNHNDLKLVLMGKNVVPIPAHPDIISLGFVSEEDKFNGIAGAKVLVQPSLY
ncbi:MAG: glycosyltransferase family 4 protein, partial [Clostridiales bacterium]|nr:glycosyltransferase family 4 protein [Clostridiales bacterium]